MALKVVHQHPVIAEVAAVKAAGTVTEMVHWVVLPAVALIAAEVAAVDRWDRSVVVADALPLPLKAAEAQMLDRQVHCRVHSHHLEQSQHS